MSIWTLVLAAATPQAADAAASPALLPDGKWEVGPEQQQCAASRHFGSGSQRRTIAFRPFPFSDSMEIVVLSPQGSGRARSGDTKIALEPGGATIAAKFEAVALPSGGRVTRIWFDRPTDGRLADADVLAIKADAERARFAIGKPANALRALTACETELIASWGADPALMKAAVRPAIKGNPGSLFGPEAFPREALAAHVEGEAVTLLTIDRAGGVADCRVVVKSPHPSLDTATCLQGRKISFTPALDASGSPIAAHYLLPVRWFLPTFTDR